MTTVIPTARALTLLLAGLLLAPGCAAIGALTQAATPLDAYSLTPAAATRGTASTARQITVELPTASGAIDTDRILFKPNRLRTQYLPGVRWIDPAPSLVQSLLVASLQDTGAFRHVGRPQAGPFPDYTVLTEIRAFEAAATTAEGPPYQIRVGLVLSLVREEDNQIIASSAFSAERSTDALEPEILVPAFDAATDQVLRDAVAWLLARFGITA
jgi:cholesterol transport system auxiliary component